MLSTPCVLLSVCVWYHCLSQTGELIFVCASLCFSIHLSFNRWRIKSSPIDAVLLACWSVWRTWMTTPLSSQWWCMMDRCMNRLLSDPLFSWWQHSIRTRARTLRSLTVLTQVHKRTTSRNPNTHFKCIFYYLKKLSVIFKYFQLV